METLKFKTNIDCGGCVAKVTPVLNSLKGVEAWQVDTNSKDKTLSVTANQGLTPAQVSQALISIGFQSQSI